MHDESQPGGRGGGDDFGVAVAGDALGAALAAVMGFDDFSAKAAGGKGGGGGGGSNGGKPGSGDGGTGSGGTTPASYTSDGITHDASQDFNITIDYSGSWTQAQVEVVQWAADTISHIITADIRDDTDLNGRLIDDVLITISTGNIDRGGKGAMGNVLAQTTVDVVRDPGTDGQWLPLNASMTLDSYDLDNAASNGTNGAWDVIVLHEMMHAVGFYGYIFDKLGVASGNSFVGADAVAAYNNGASIPLNADGGLYPGSHWAENSFAPDGTAMSNELMTNLIESYTGDTVLTDVTVAALQDIGYTVDDADPETLGGHATSWVVDSGLFIA